MVKELEISYEHLDDLETSFKDVTTLIITKPDLVPPYFPSTLRKLIIYG